MKAGTQNHLKTKRLMRLLGIPLYRAVGILETIWLLCADCCDDGRIGKYTDEEIADYLGWEDSANGAPCPALSQNVPPLSRLVRALVDSGWIDRDDDARLIVHDWDDHCPEFIKERIRKRVQRGAMPRNYPTYAESSRDKPGTLRDNTGQERDQPGYVQSIPNQTKPNQFKPIQTTTTPKPPPKNSAVASIGGGGGGGGNLNSWNEENETRARIALSDCGFVRKDELLRECQELCIAPAVVLLVCDEYRANRKTLNGAGAIAIRLRTGSWPADGVVSIEQNEKQATAKKNRQRALDIEAYRVRLKKAGVADVGELSEADVVRRAEELKLV